MEYPVPDLDYYQKIVFNCKHRSHEDLAFELQDLINEVKVYMGSLQKQNSILTEGTNKI